MLLVLSIFTLSWLWTHYQLVFTLLLLAVVIIAQVAELIYFIAENQSRAAKISGCPALW